MSMTVLDAVEAIPCVIEPTDPPVVVNELTRMFLDQETVLMPVALDTNSQLRLNAALAENSGSRDTGRIHRFKKLQQPQWAEVYEQDKTFKPNPVEILEMSLHELSQSRSTWIGRAACTGLDPEVFHPSRPGGGDNTRAKEELMELINKAVGVCEGCPVTDNCRESAKEFGKSHLGRNEVRIIAGEVFMGDRVKKRFKDKTTS